MSDNRTTQDEASSQDGLTSGVRILVALCAAFLIFYFIYALMVDSKPLATVFACALLCVFLLIFIFLSLNPDILRSQYTEQTLSSASEMLEDIKDGLTPEGAEAICRRLLTETRAMAIAMTDDTCVLACAGDLANDFPPGSPIHTPATHYVLEHGIVQSFTHAVDVKSEARGHREIPAGIIAPLKVRGKAVGTLKFYYRRSHEVNRTQYALASGFAELISTQLAIHELELQSELTARAEVRALQAQINPHFLFNTLNTIASLTRTEPLRARELLREFASFYRATLDNSGSLIPVEREIEQTLRYLTFEKARFGEDREETLVPAFVIQPLVENAVRHAMDDEDPLHIEISVASEGESMVRIEVKDDGVGMDEQTAARLFSTDREAPRTDAPQGGGAGVAMHNIADRIVRFYGPRSSTQVISSPGAGTSVVLHLDLQKSILE